MVSVVFHKEWVYADALQHPVFYSVRPRHISIFALTRSASRRLAGTHHPTRSKEWLSREVNTETKATKKLTYSEKKWVGFSFPTQAHLQTVTGVAPNEQIMFSGCFI